MHTGADDHRGGEPSIAMTACSVAIIGAGPYGLAVAAPLARRRRHRADIRRRDGVLEEPAAARHAAAIGLGCLAHQRPPKRLQPERLSGAARSAARPPGSAG